MSIDCSGNKTNGVILKHLPLNEILEEDEP